MHEEVKQKEREGLCKALHILNSGDEETLFAHVLDAEHSLVRHINTCYTDLQVSKEQMLGYTQTAAYCPNLWLFAKDASSGEILGSGIADYDEETRELILEWIQVLPVHRRKGVGQGIVNELLRRRPPNASFATVSGKADSISHPETLYRRCGFSGHDYWHILSK